VKLIGEHDAAQARATAFEVRVQRATDQLEKARTDLARIEAAGKVEAAKAAMQALAAHGREMNRVATSARSKLEVLHRDFVKAVEVAVEAYNSLPTAELRDEVGAPGNHSPWEQVFLRHGDDILELAARLSRSTP